MTGLAAIALGGMFTSCSHDTGIGESSANLGVVETYEKAFVNRFGTPSPEADWGFGSDAKAGTRSGNMTGKEKVAETSTGINANANEWADKADAPHGHGGWLVPPALTEPQKEVVRKYFQANPKLEYKDPHFANFFVQQVYKGGTSKPETGNKETNKGANGSSYSSDNMNLLTVGYNEQHINNFNKGTYNAETVATDSYGNPLSGTKAADGMVNVLDNGYTVNDFANHHHPDQIMLMVNIDDTGCMGYHNSGCSKQRNDKAALVGWETIRTWARGQGIYTEDILNDGWNRSFVGFDFALYNLDESYHKNGNDNVYAQFSNGQNNGLKYVWDGKKVMKRGEKSATRKAKARYSTRTDGASVDVWIGNEKKENNNAKSISFSDEAKKLLVAGNYLGVDLSVVTQWEWGTYSDWRVKFQGEWGNNYALHSGEITLNANSTNVEIKLTEADIAIIKQQTLYLWALNNPIIFTRIYISEYSQANGSNDDNQGSGDNENQGSGEDNQTQEENYEIYEGNYLIVDGKQIPFLKTNMNMYGGILYGGRDEALSDSEMKITKDGKECFNLEKIKELVDDGYLPVWDKNLRTWVKWEYGDGYFSDWIVTLTEAKRASNENSGGNEEEEDNTFESVVRVIAEDMGDQTPNEDSDFDFNDVVFDVTYVSEGEVKIKILAAGGTLPLTVGWNGSGDYITHEVHYMLGYSEATMINTNANVGYHQDGVAPYEFKYTGTFRKDYFRQDVRDNIPLKVRKSGVWYDITAPIGKAAGKLCVGTDYEWCDERLDIDTKWRNAEGGLFLQYVNNPTKLTNYWYRNAYGYNQ